MTEELLSIIYPLLYEQYTVYYSIECISATAKFNPSVVDVVKVTEFGSTNITYMQAICGTLTAIGTDDATSEVIIPVCLVMYDTGLGIAGFLDRNYKITCKHQLMRR